MVQDAVALSSSRDRPYGPESRTAGIVGRPDARLRLATVLAAVPLCLVFARMVQLACISDEIISSAGHAVRTVLEPIPARDGRILSADGRVLAEDVETFSLLVQYRWFEEPPNEAWLRGEALATLDRAARRQREAIEHAEQQVLVRREELWNALARCGGVTVDELKKRFQVHRARVIDVRAAVEQARAAEGGAARPAPSSATTWWQAGADNLWDALTTSPRRRDDEPLVLLEELQAYEVARGVPLATAAEIEAHPERFPGTQVRILSERRYPFGATASHLIGYRFQKGSGDAESAIASGQTGVERSYDRHVRGVDGLRKLWVDRHGETVRHVVLREPRVGKDLVLDMDLGLQKELESSLDAALAAVRAGSHDIPPAAGGCVIAMDVRTGAILAAASAPRFDLGEAANRDPQFWNEVLADESLPMFDRARSAALPPGSVFKLVSAVALLDSKRIDPDAAFECVGYLERKDRHRDYIFTHFGVGHGRTTLTSALAESCNVYFFNAAKRLGARPMVLWAERLGFGRVTGLDLPAEAAGHLPAANREADPLGISIGQADVTATPLQVVRSMAAIANGGRLVTPHVVRGAGPVQETSGAVRPFVRSEQVEGLNRDILGRIREGLEAVVSHPRGSGYKTVRHRQVAIAGKTGTAEVGGGRPDHAWFAGYAPADDPQVAFVVLLEHAGSGGQAAGPLAHATVDALLRHGFFR